MAYQRIEVTHALRHAALWLAVSIFPSDLDEQSAARGSIKPSTRTS